MLASIRNAERGIDVLPEQIVFERVAEEVFQRYQRHWKPATLKVNQGYYRNQILPWFKGRPIADITRHDVQQWFASLHERLHVHRRNQPHLVAELLETESGGSHSQLVVKDTRSMLLYSGRWRHVNEDVL